MRRRVSIVIAGILVVVAAAFASRYVVTARRGQRGAVPDSVSREVDTMCIASRIGLPCDTH